MKRRSIRLMLFLSAAWPAAGGTAPLHPPPPVPDSITASSWTLLVEASVTGAHDSLATFGVRPDATPEYDAQYEVPRPPAPPGTSVQAFFPHQGGTWPAFLGDRFATDMTAPGEPSWRMLVETNAGNVPVSLAWDAGAVASLPGSYSITIYDSIADSVIAMREVGSYAFAYAGPRVFHIEAEFAATTVQVTAGWNIVSLPNVAQDRSVDALFPSRTSSAFGFDSAYHQSDTLDPGAGYWLKFGSDGSSTLAGPGVDSVDIPLRDGWNMVGALSRAIAPPDLAGLSTPFYEYVGGYRRADSLVPGRGYWVKAAGEMVLPLRPSSMQSGAKKIADPPDPLASIEFRQAEGSAAELFVLGAIRAGDRGSFDLPPVPPAPSFDARFSSGGAGAVLSGGEDDARTLEVVLQSDGRPVTVRAAVPAAQDGLDILTGPDQWEAITGTSEPVALLLGPGRHFLRLRLTPRTTPPREFALAGNYPNPFNPSTTIVYDLPLASFVTLTVADPAGRVVHRGATAFREAGRNDLTFEPGRHGLAAGVYFYLLEARTARTGALLRSAGKMVYLK